MTRKHKIILIGALMILVVLLMLSPAFFKLKIYNLDNDILESIYYNSQIVSSVFVITGVFIAVWQYILSVRNANTTRIRELDLREKEIYEMNRAQIQKAIDLSECFKTKIIEKMNPIVLAFNSSYLSEIAKKIPAEKMIRFDMLELRKCISEDEIKKIREIGNTQEFVDILVQICLTYDEWNAYVDEVNVTENGKPERKIRINKELILNKYQHLLVDILNDMEYISMNFMYGTADEKVVYQSLHSSYIFVVEMLYSSICMNNDGPIEQKLFTNVIALYQVWKKRSLEQIENEYAAADEQIIQGKKLR